MGYKINKKEYELDDALFEKINKFPMPTMMKTMIAWFGLVNQATHMDPSLVKIMEPLKQYLKKNSTNPVCTKETENVFVDSKEPIVEIMNINMMRYSMQKETILVTDWSK